MNKYKRISSDILIFICGSVLTKIMQFLLMPLYTSYLTVEAYGVAELINNFAEFLYPIITLCIYEAAFRFAVDPKYDNKLIASSCYKVLVSSFAILIVGFVIIQSIFDISHIGLFVFVLYAYCFRMLSAYYVRGKGFSKVFAFSGFVNAIFLAIFSIVLIVIKNMGVNGYLLSIALSYSCSAVFMFIFGRIYRDISLKTTEKGIYTVLLAYSTPLVLYNVGYWLTVLSGRYILLWFTDSKTVGLYMAAIKISAVINMLQQAFYAAFQLNTAIESGKEGSENFFSNIFKYYSSGIMLFGSMIICLSPMLSTLLLQKSFNIAGTYIPLILLASILDCVFCFHKSMYSAYKKTKYTIGGIVIGVVVNIVACFVLVPSIGIWGVCIASLLCYVSQSVYRMYDVRKFVNINNNLVIIIPTVLLLGAQVWLMTVQVKNYLVISFSMSVFLTAWYAFLYKKEIQMLTRAFTNVSLGR